MFITFEGIDGSGKSTQARFLAERLRADGREVVQTKEPGGCDICVPLRGMVISGALRHPWSEPYLFMLDRAEHVANVIEPALANGADVICERYHDSTLAYQVWGRGLPLHIFDELFQLSRFPTPDLTVFFDLPVDEALARVSKRGAADAFEKEGAAFMSRIRSGYLELCRRDAERWLTIDVSDADENGVFGRLLKALDERGVFSG